MIIMPIIFSCALTFHYLYQLLVWLSNKIRITASSSTILLALAIRISYYCIHQTAIQVVSHDTYVYGVIYFI